jgi:transposase InsO family protein
VRAEKISTGDVAEELQVSRRWVQKLYGTYLEACGQRESDAWVPGRSGGSHHKIPSEEVEQLWRKLLGGDPPLSYSFTASETLRRCGECVDRATVRRWAVRHGLAPQKVPVREPASIRRWQCESVGALWQLDVTSHRWFGEQNEALPLYDLIDDCSRVVTGTRLYPRECLLAYLDFLRISFEKYGLPASLYVDFHSFFFTTLPDMLTYLGEVLHWIGVNFKYAPTPQAKGKVERAHQFWQKRLPAFFASEQIGQIDQANPQIDELREHHNDHEIHRELVMTPTTAWRKALREKRSVLRNRPLTPWWPYLWTVRNTVKASLDGMVRLGPSHIKLPHALGHRFTHCHHPDGSFTLLANAFGVGKPIVIRRLEGARPTWTV